MLCWKFVPSLPFLSPYPPPPLPSPFPLYLPHLSLYSKVTFVSRVEFLWEHMSEQEVEIPEFATRHDAKLEKYPLHDYGMAVDKPDLATSAVPSGP